VFFFLSSEQLKKYFSFFMYEKKRGENQGKKMMKM
jgi:hypothetical protein